MIWIVGAIILLGGFALVDYLTDSRIMRRYVNAGSDRYRAIMDLIRSRDQSILDVRVGSGEDDDPCAKQPARQLSRVTDTPPD